MKKIVRVASFTAIVFGLVILFVGWIFSIQSASDPEMLDTNFSDSIIGLTGVLIWFVGTVGLVISFLFNKN